MSSSKINSLSLSLKLFELTKLSYKNKSLCTKPKCKMYFSLHHASFEKNNECLITSNFRRKTSSYKTINSSNTKHGLRYSRKAIFIKPDQIQINIFR